MSKKDISFTSFNLYNLNEPGLAIYNDTDGWDADIYAKKVDWTQRMLKIMEADVFGFQELWHADSLQAAFTAAGFCDDYDLLIPEGHSGQRIVCAGAVRKGMLKSQPVWIDTFPEAFRLESTGDDAQTPDIDVNINGFSRPVLHFVVDPGGAKKNINVYVCHFKSKGPTKIFRESWYRKEKSKYSKHSEAIGSALSTIRRTAEAAALRIILTEQMKNTNTPVVVLGDCNDGQYSNTLNTLTGQPRFLTALKSGGSDVDLYTGQTLQQYRSQTDVYYTHVYNDTRESLDHILVSEEFYDHSRDRVWAFDGLEIANDHLNAEDHKESGTNDHGIVRARFKYKPYRK